MSGTKQIKKDLNQAFKNLSLEAAEGNVLAIHDLGYIYLKNLINIDIEESKKLSDDFFEKALKGFHYLYDNQSSAKFKEYLAYRIGKMYSYGYGTEQNYEKAFEYFMKAQGNKYAQFSLGSLYQYENGVDQSDENAFTYYKLSADQDNAFAQFKVAEFAQHKKVENNNSKLASLYYEKAFINFLKIDEDNPDHNVKYKLGYMYFNGYGTKKDIDEAKKYFLSSLKENDNSKYMLSKIYISDPISSPEERQLACTWLQQLAEKENVLAQYTLGKMYLSGQVVDQDKSMAIKYLTSAADQNNEYAQYALGKFFLSEGEYKNIPEAVAWLKKAAENNNQFAQYTLGKMYLSGQDVDQNKSMAIKYLTSAADQNNEYAQYALGKFFLSEGEHKNIPEAVTWLKKAAENNNQFAQYTLGKFYLSGQDVDQDKPLAIKYLTSAADQNNQYAQYQLGKFYLKDKEYTDTALGIEYLHKAADQGNAPAQNQLARLYDPDIRNKFQYDKNEYAKRKSQLLAATCVLRRLVNQIDGHLNQLKREFDYEEEQILAEEQYELQFQEEYERS